MGDGMQNCFDECGVVMLSLHQTCTMQCFVGVGVFAVRLGSRILLPQLTVVRLLVVGDGGVWVDLLCGWFVWIQLLQCELSFILPL